MPPPTVPRMAGSLTDVPGIIVGHHQRTGRGWRTGTSVVLTPQGAVAGVDVRGGGPGTRETDLLRPENLIQTIHGVCLSGGSAFGLAAADGVMAHLASLPAGFRVGPDPAWVVPIVPSAVIFDLGRGGRLDARPDATFGYRAARRASRHPVAEGAVGAGAGALSGGVQGGVGSASTVLDNGVVVGALVVVNSSGTLIDPDTALPWEHSGHGVRRPSSTDRGRWRSHLADVEARRSAPPANTTIGVVAVSAALSKSECARLATVAHDGLARAIRPAHSLNDGDTVFSLATGHQELPLAAGAPDDAFRSPTGRAAGVNQLLAAAASVFSVACVRALLTAESFGNGPPSYRDLVPSAFG